MVGWRVELGGGWWARNDAAALAEAREGWGWIEGRLGMTLQPWRRLERVGEQMKAVSMLSSVPGRFDLYMFFVPAI